MRFSLVLVLAALTLQSCQSKKIIEPEMPKKVATQTISVSSNPLGADVWANGQKVGVTPTVVTLEKNRDHQVVFSKEGFQPQVVTVTRKRDPAQMIARITSSAFNHEGKFKDPLAAGEFAYRAEEATGELSILEPTVIAVSLEAIKK